MIHVSSQLFRPLNSINNGNGSQTRKQVHIIKGDSSLRTVFTRVDDIIQGHQLTVQFFNVIRGVAGHEFGVFRQLFRQGLQLPIGLGVSGQLMVFDKGVTGIQLLEFRQQTSGHIARSLHAAQQVAHAALPFLNVLTSRGGGNVVGGSTAFILIDVVDDIHGFGHDQITPFHNGSHFLANQLGGCLDIIIGQKVKIVLNVLQSERQSNSHTKGTVVVDVKSRKDFRDNSFWSGSRLGFFQFGRRGGVGRLEQGGSASDKWRAGHGSLEGLSCRQRKQQKGRQFRHGSDGLKGTEEMNASIYQQRKDGKRIEDVALNVESLQRYARRCK
mmetsp:Transcript_6255/g.13035  ORF Transcript_6255/g.13035 Transcript_6255/m.13035 type:complete len:328 (-) Transcript_6255:21-1004(-)